MFPSVLAILAPLPIFGLIVGMFWLETRLFPPQHDPHSPPATDPTTPMHTDPLPQLRPGRRERAQRRAHPGASILAPRARGARGTRPHPPRRR